MKGCVHSLVYVGVCLCIHRYRKDQKRKWAFSSLQRSESQSRECGKGGTTAPATTLHCKQSRARAGKWWAATWVYPAQANCGTALVCCPEGVPSPSRAYAHTHIYTKMNTHTHTLSACPLCSRSYLIATVELWIAKKIFKVSQLNFSQQSQLIQSLPLFAAWQLPRHVGCSGLCGCDSLFGERSPEKKLSCRLTP